jgi:hypothetical protein
MCLRRSNLMLLLMGTTVHVVVVILRILSLHRLSLFPVAIYLLLAVSSRAVGVGHMLPHAHGPKAAIDRAGIALSESVGRQSYSSWIMKQ